MPSDQRRLVEQIVRAAGESVSGLGLRFDRVVARVLGDLQRCAAAAAPAGTTLILTLTAPIRMPARTTRTLEQQITEMIGTSAASADRSTILCGNTVRMRVVRKRANQACALIGFVHNPDSDAGHLLDIAEQWLRARRS